MEFVKSFHPILALIMLVCYGVLAWRFFRRQDVPRPVDKTLAQVVRFSLLLTYFSGLVMSMNMGLFAPRMHHYASLLPVAVIFFFQFLPQTMGKALNKKGYGFMFLAMFLCVAFISYTSGIIRLH